MVTFEKRCMPRGLRDVACACQTTASLLCWLKHSNRYHVEVVAEEGVGTHSLLSTCHVEFLHLPLSLPQVLAKYGG